MPYNVVGMITLLPTHIFIYLGNLRRQQNLSCTASGNQVNPLKYFIFENMCAVTTDLAFIEQKHSWKTGGGSLLELRKISSAPPASPPPDLVLISPPAIAWISSLGDALVDPLSQFAQAWRPHLPIKLPGVLNYKVGPDLVQNWPT